MFVRFWMPVIFFMNSFRKTVKPFKCEDVWLGPWFRVLEVVFVLALLRRTWDVTFTLASMNLFLHDGDDETVFRVLNIG